MDINTYYAHVQKMGKLPTRPIAERWSYGVLKTLGAHLDSNTKKELQSAIDPQLAKPIGAYFNLFPFRDPTVTSYEFQNEVARRCGNSDAVFARFPTVAVFNALKQQIDGNLSQKVADSLPDEVSQLWQEA
ncbi:MAG TPA: DUF2267 domain-containing protein [Anaerolineae bacterium]|nr:DUF2267 domain-containing protein [Anaerolineae bacterium]